MRFFGRCEDVFQRIPGKENPTFFCVKETLFSKTSWTASDWWFFLSRLFLCQCESMNLSIKILARKWTIMKNQENEQSWTICSLVNPFQSIFSFKFCDFGVVCCLHVDPYPAGSRTAWGTKAQARTWHQKQKRILNGGNGDPWALLNGLGLGAVFFYVGCVLKVEFEVYVQILEILWSIMKSIDGILQQFGMSLSHRRSFTCQVENRFLPTPIHKKMEAAKQQESSTQNMIKTQGIKV